MLRFRLEARKSETQSLWKVIRQSIDLAPPESNLFALYQSGAERLAQSGETAAAIELLREGIERIRPEHNLFSLYQAGGEILARQDDYPAAIELLKDGLRRMPQGKWSRPRIGEAALYLCLGLRDGSEIQGLISDQAPLALDEHQRRLGEVFIQQDRRALACRR